jgi:serine/threonine protein kinase
MAAPLDKKYLKEEEHEFTPDGNKRYTICGMKFETTPNYAVRKAVGQGAYGLVCSGRNVETNRLVALKKIPKAFEDTVDCKRLLREIKILRHFKHDNVLGLLDILPPPDGSAKTWKDVVCHRTRRNSSRVPWVAPSRPRLARAVLPYLTPRLSLLPAVHRVRADGHGPALHHPLEAASDRRALQILPLPDPSRRPRHSPGACAASRPEGASTRQWRAPLADCHRPAPRSSALAPDTPAARPELTRGLPRTVSQPGNLLVNKNCDLKICDFGLARAIDPSDEKKDLGLTEYVVTRWYRAPELLVENQTYTTAIDVWAVGCIFAEMLGRKALFPGRDYLHQLRLIIDVLGTPTEEDLACITNAQAVQFLRTLPLKPRKPWADVFPNASPQALELLNDMLVFNPSKRCTMVDALNSEYMAALHQGRELPAEEEHFSFLFEKPDITQEELREMIWSEMASFHPDKAK